ncbi:MAG: CvpA family protein [Gammaproteobacteria bacterium]|nr:MAG: CvpA family protein [Gammaproteobacteria bacterium]
MKGIAVDLIILLLIVLSILLGAYRGFIKEFFSVVVWVTAATVSILYAPQVQKMLGDMLPAGEVGLILAFLLIFIGAFFLLSVVTYVLSKLVRRSALRGADVSMGAMFGLLRGIVMMVLLVWMVNTLLPSLKQSSQWQSSMLVYYFSQVPGWVMEMDLPSQFESGKQWVDNMLHERSR